MHTRKSCNTLENSVFNAVSAILRVNCVRHINISFSSLTYNSLFYAELNLKLKVYVFVTGWIRKSIRDLVGDLCRKK